MTHYTHSFIHGIRYPITNSTTRATPTHLSTTAVTEYGETTEPTSTSPVPQPPAPLDPSSKMAIALGCITALVLLATVSYHILRRRRDNKNNKNNGNHMNLQNLHGPMTPKAENTDLYYELDYKQTDSTTASPALEIDGTELTFLPAELPNSR